MKGAGLFTAGSGEMDKKFQRTIEALKQEIGDRNTDISRLTTELQGVNDRLTREKKITADLQEKLINRNDKPPQQTKDQSEKEFSLEENMKLKDQIFHLQNVNSELTRSVQVKLKIELAQLMQEKEKGEDKLKIARTQLRQKQDEIDRLINYRPTDDVATREASQYSKQKQIDMLTEELSTYEKDNREMQEKLFRTEERLLDLKFEKETFDLQYARLQKRITDLENYKLHASQLSAVLKQQYEEELDQIRDDTEKLRGDSLSRQPGDSVKLKPKKNRTAQELESVIEQLKRVVEKQRIQISELEKETKGQKETLKKRSEEPAMRKEIEKLERVVQSYENADRRSNEQQGTINKLLFANKTLREDLQQEIDRYTLLQDKYKEILIKYNVLKKENERNEKNLFAMGTGASLKKHEAFLDPEGEFAPTR